MIPKKDYAKVREELRTCLARVFDDVQVEIGDDVYYRGTNVVVTSPVFAGLLPEQRYHHVVRAIPPGFYDQYLRRGVIWFELAPGETGADLMKMPRSEDLAADEPAVARQLSECGFFAQLGAFFQRSPDAASAIDFTASRQVMRRMNFTEQQATRACLFFIRHGGFCDLQVLADVMPKIAGRRVAT